MSLSQQQKNDRYHFGGIREQILERDGYACINCGMTLEEHLQRWGTRLTVNHKDGRGRNSLEPNNDPDNLETLCVSCHGRKDGFKPRLIHSYD